MSMVLDSLNNFSDPRDPRKISHPLTTILFIAICAIFCGAEGWEDIVTWAETRKEWLSQYVDISNGIPSYSTVRRVFIIVSPSCWGNFIHKKIDYHHPNKKPEDQIPIDGKSLCGSKCDSKDIRAMQIVHAWSVENGIILQEVKTDSKSNEITAIPLLLDLLNLEGATVSIDAIECNEKIINTILDKGAHYVLGLKKNQPRLFEAVEQHMQKNAVNTDNLVRDEFDNSHGRSVRRRYFVCDIPDKISHLGMPKMSSLVATETISSTNHKVGVSSEWRYYITDHDQSQSSLPDYVRNHWQVESTHWSLDVHLNDDKDKKYEEKAAENFAKTKRFLFNLVRSRPPEGKKRSVRSNLKRVGWDLDYLVRLLFPPQ